MRAVRCSTRRDGNCTRVNASGQICRKYADAQCRWRRAGRRRNCQPVDARRRAGRNGEAQRRVIGTADSDGLRGRQRTAGLITERSRRSAQRQQRSRAYAERYWDIGDYCAAAALSDGDVSEVSPRGQICRIYSNGDGYWRCRRRLRHREPAPARGRRRSQSDCAGTSYVQVLRRRN